jgi:hypothetical protein
MKNFLLLTLLFAAQAMAGQADLSWTAPTQNEDGTPYDDPGGFIVYWGATSGNYPTNHTINDPDAVTYTVADLTEGDWFFVVTAFDDEQPPNESDYSNETTKSISDVLPLPPGGVAIAGEKAYIIITSEDALVLLDIGTVTADVTCSASVGMRDDNGVLAYKIPRSAVTPYNQGQELVAVFAACGN